MKTRLLWILVAVGALGVGPQLRADDAGQKAVDDTRQELRRDGFKTDFSEFDFSTPPEMRDRAVVLSQTDQLRVAGQYVNHPDLMEAAGTNGVIVIWKMDGFKRQFPTGPNEGDEMSWEEFRNVIKPIEPRLDAASAVILSGPIRFNLDASRGSSMQLPHLAMLKNLTEMFGSRAALALHDGNRDAAWTNLMAATRLVTAWQVEPVEVSQINRFNDARLAFSAIWQALQTNGWPDQRLASLQAEWEAADFFTNLAEAAAFMRASAAADCARDRERVLSSRPGFSEFYNEGAKSTPSTNELAERWRQTQYAEHDSFVDEKKLLLFYRDRELELRNAVQAPTWSAMRQLPGVTNAPVFQAAGRSLTLMRLTQRERMIGLQTAGAGLLGGAARAETERRLVVTALALERYRIRHSTYPKSLAELTPGFLKKPAVDFMDGQPLRYRLTQDGHFILYSIGVDCVDNGGPTGQHQALDPSDFVRGNFLVLPPGDIIWPLPATSNAVAALRLAERKEQERNREQAEDAQAQWTHTARHQAAVEKILAGPADPDPPDLKYRGGRLSELLRNEKPGSKPLTLREMLTLTSVITGAEPETITFEFPIRYDALVQVGGLFLNVDANNDDSDEGCGAQQVEFSRATNGNCRVAWSTIFESPGKHALQAGLELRDLPPGGSALCGPRLPCTISNLAQFSLASATFDLTIGAILHAKLPEKRGDYRIDLLTTNGAPLKTITGSTSNGVIKEHWDLIDSKGGRFTDDGFNSILHITLPESGRSQTLRGP